MRTILTAAAACLALALPGVTIASPARARDRGASATSTASCNRECLYGYLDHYLKALAARNPSGLPLASNVKFSENNVMMKVGDGLWNTITALGSGGVRLADVPDGEVGYLDVVQEGKTDSPFAMRMKIAGGKITQIETVVARPSGTIPPPTLDHFATRHWFEGTLPAGERSSRAKMIQLVEGYFDTLQRNNGTIHTTFDPDCNREENAKRSTNNPSYHIFPVTNLGCEAQFKTGYFYYDDRARSRAFPVVDTERGLILARVFLDHSGNVTNYKLTDGRKLTSPFTTPSSLCILELFKIRSGKIYQIEATMAQVPYNMPSVWGAN
ncbi:MAG TPA: hypothetical protein VNK23_17690 [Candidatus Dormibacteraeota bacterium]|nr:hypothetical protein [Candidatus Dormibacteraeota bacterium]